MTDKKTKSDSDISKLNFEQAMSQLREIVEKVETGQIGLEEAISQYENGCKLVQHCKRILENAERKIEVLSKGLDGELKSQPFESQETSVEETEEQG
jgi:exodeoxyribonuclease VII small subunit